MAGNMPTVDVCSNQQRSVDHDCEIVLTFGFKSCAINFVTFKIFTTIRVLRGKLKCYS
jgi:hypothetical protein